MARKMLEKFNLNFPFHEVEIWCHDLEKSHGNAFNECSLSEK